MVKVDANAESEESRLLPLHQHASSRRQRGRHVTRRRRRRSRRSKPARPSAVRCGTCWATGRRPCRTGRSTSCGSPTASTSRGFSPTLPAALAARTCWRPPATTRRWATRPASSRASVIRAPTSAATSFTGLEGEGNLFIIDNFSLVAGQHQFKFGGIVARQQMYMDVEAAHKGRSRSRRTSCSTSTILELSHQLQRQHRLGRGQRRRSGTRRCTSRTHGSSAAT